MLALGVLGSLGPEVGAAATPTMPTWSELSPPSSPPGLRGAASAYDPLNGTVVVFGGITASGSYSSATWIWNGSTWTQAVSRLGSVPEARAFASIAFDAAVSEPQLILYGGETATGALLDDTWSWNGSSWYPVTTTDSPGGRYGAALGADSLGNLVLFGGYGQTDAVPTMTNASSTTTAPPATSPTTTRHPTSSTTRPTTTTTAPAPTTTTTAPAPTTTTSLGAPAGTTTTTTTVAGSAASPSARRLHADAVETAVLRTSAKAAVAGPRVLGDTWLLQQSDGVDNWVRSAATGPPALIGATLSGGPDGQSVLFGGSTVRPGTAAAVAAVNSTWVWTGSAWHATQVTRPPQARVDAAAGYDPSLGGLVLFGGLGRYGVLDDTWRWNGATWLPLTAGTPPAARRSAASAFDVAGDELLVFGGTGRRGVTLSDTVLLSTHPPQPISVNPTPTPSATTTTHTASTSGASGPTTTAPLRTARPTQVRRGSVVALSGSGFTPHAAIVITFHSTPTVVGRTQADASGSFEANVTVPDKAAGGTHHFEAEGAGPGGETIRLTPVDVVGVAVTNAFGRVDELVLVGIALAVPIVSWFALGGVLRLRRRARRMA